MRLEALFALNESFYKKCENMQDWFGYQESFKKDDFIRYFIEEWSGAVASLLLGMIFLRLYIKSW